jgi:hypothetical protein
MIVPPYDEIQRLVDYNWDDERIDFQIQESEQGDDFNPRHHIFTAIREIDAWLTEIARQEGDPQC